MRKVLAAAVLILAAFIAAYTQGIQRPGGGAGSASSTRNIQGGTYFFCEDVSANDDYACTMDPAVTSILNGAIVKLDPNTTNTTTSTLDVGPGAIDIFRLGDAGVLISGDILANSPAWLLYCAACDSAAGAWILTNPVEASPGVAAHAAEHETGGGDLLDLASLPGTLAMSQTNFAVTANGRISFSTPTITVRDLETKECIFTNPVTGHSDVCQLKWPYDFVVTRIHGNTTTATSTVDIEFEERAEATPNTAGTEVMGADLQLTTTGASDTTFANDTIAANVPMSLKITAVANAPTVARVYVTGHPANF